MKSNGVYLKTDFYCVSRVMQDHCFWHSLRRLVAFSTVQFSAFLFLSFFFISFLVFMTRDSMQDMLEYVCVHRVKLLL